ncbi:hypothetical protein BDB00DRAFT_603406 [Zychaea mexicana]|uniref:uncharacterized protein n=1 Tax=Zychaea mexicana TaxID=64656 RepID=UPI0022FED10E|nr:uncharacterized protein BDB00DRAFT_603406 [Zychaea mexicana]KAI9489685.1 hypothetical protein BDB00DRAFT_603406 [Zychaea mexicana]
MDNHFLLRLSIMMSIQYQLLFCHAQPAVDACTQPPVEHKDHRTTMDDFGCSSKDALKAIIDTQKLGNGSEQQDRKAAYVNKIKLVSNQLGSMILDLFIIGRLFSLFLSQRFDELLLFLGRRGEHHMEDRGLYKILSGTNLTLLKSLIHFTFTAVAQPSSNVYRIIV